MEVCRTGGGGGLEGYTTVALSLLCSAGAWLRAIAPLDLCPRKARWTLKHVQHDDEA